MKRKTEKMKRKTGISLMMALLMVVSTFAVVGGLGAGGEEWSKGSIDFCKEVWNGTGWDESVEKQVGETVEFKITLTYHKHPDNTDPWTLSTIKIKDLLPECLDYDSLISITTTGTSPIEYTEAISGKWVYWNFTWDKPELADEESLIIKFNATVIESQETENQNIAYVKAKEDCTYWHEDDDDALVIIVESGEPGIAIDKKVWDGEDWNDEGITDYICLLLGEDQCIDFQINVSNTGEIALTNVIVTDVLPEFLKYKSGSASPPEAWVSSDMRTIVWVGIIPVDGYVLITFTACIWPQYFLMHDMAEGDNVANATSDQTEVVEDSVYVKLFKRLSVDKKVWDGEEWVDELERVIKGQEVKFRITATYHGEPQSLMDCALLGDLLSNDCLEYNETTLVQVAGQTLEPGTYQYPYVIPDHGTTLVICGQEVEIPELIQCQEDEYYVIIWDFREAWYFELHDGENITIEFTTNMTQYCECYNVDFAFAIGWGCYVCDPCNYYLDWDCARVNCSPPIKFSKKVWDVEEELWADQGFGIVGQEMEFKIEFEYYGNDVLTDIRFKDVLPCVLEFTGVIESSINISVWVSEDKKLIWFNMSEDTVEDCDVVIIRFTALVTGVTGDCCPDPAKNRVWLYIYGCPGQVTDEYYDEVCLTTRENVPPCPPDVTGDTYGIVDQKLTFQALASDPNGDDIYYMFDWGDETYSEWLGPYNSGEEVETNHSWNTIGEYKVTAKAKDTFGAESDWTPYPLTVEIVNNPPTAPVINGPTNGDVGTSYPYTFTSTDSDGDQVSYYVDWGDGTTPVWSSFQASGTPYSESHTWTSNGTYIIQAKAKDTFGEESDWSDPLTVEIVEPGTPKLSVTIKRGLGRGISFDIENTGDVDVNDITWNLTVTRRGLIKNGEILLQCNGTISALEPSSIPALGPGSKETITNTSAFGISLITVTVKVDAPDIDPISETAKGFIILKFVRLRMLL